MVPGAWGEANREMRGKATGLDTEQGLNSAISASIAQSVGWGFVGAVKIQRDHTYSSAQA